MYVMLDSFLYNFDNSCSIKECVLSTVSAIVVCYSTNMAAQKRFGKEVSTTSPDCQTWIDHGILEMYGFNHEEAIRCFQKALGYDDNCAMAHYFIAYSNAADYNNPDGLDYAVGYEESVKAMEKAKNGKVFDWEMELIKAQLHRFCWPPGSQPVEELHRKYADEMRVVYQKFGKDDADIAALFAESLMMLAPWKLWTPSPDYKPGIPETEELVTVLETGLKASPQHPGLCHFYVHTMELSATPEKALPAADTLRNGFQHGHLLHMASHIDMWIGHYQEAIDVNKKAIDADEAYVQKSGIVNEFYKSYRLHNYHLAVWAAMFDGQFATAMQYSEAMEKQLGPEAVTFKLGGLPIGSMFLEPFSSVTWHVLIRFGKWEEIINQPLKEDKDMYASAVATAHYARTIAYAVTGRIGEAETERKKFYDALNNKAIELRYLFNNVMHDGENFGGILDVGEAVLNGELEYYKGNHQEAFKFLRLAVERDKNLPYDEPWGWMMPARHVLGALLVEQGEVAEAEAIYREDLKQYKDNLWSLLGLSQALKQQGKTEEAELVRASFEKASVRTDIKIQASCLCATKICCQ